MIFEISEDAFNDLHLKIISIYEGLPWDKAERITDRVTIASLNSTKILFSLCLDSTTVQLECKATVERDGATQVDFLPLYKALKPLKGEASFYRFINEKDTGSLKITFDVGSIVLSSHQLSDQHEPSYQIDTEPWDLISTTTTSELVDSWEFLKTSLNSEKRPDDDFVFDQVVAFNSKRKGPISLQTTDGNQLSQFPLETSEEVTEDFLGLMNPLFIKALTHILKDHQDTKVRIIRWNQQGEAEDKEKAPSVFGVDNNTKDLAFHLDGVLLATHTEDFRYPSFKRLLAKEDDEMLLLIPREDFCKGLDVAYQAVNGRDCVLKTSFLGSGKNKIEETFPQLKNQKDIQGVLSVKTEYSSFDIIVPFAKNFEETEKLVNISYLINSVEKMTSDAVILKIPSKDSNNVICVREPKNKDKVKAFSTPKS